MVLRQPENAGNVVHSEYLYLSPAFHVFWAPYFPFKKFLTKSPSEFFRHQLLTQFVLLEIVVDFGAGGVEAGERHLTMP